MNRPVGVGEEDEDLGAHQMGDERGEPVVVAVADLVVGDGVVLVDDRDDTEVEEPAEGLSGVEVLGALPEVVGGEEHLAGDELAGVEELGDAGHEPGLADRGDRLEGADVTGALVEAEGGKSGGDRPRADQHHLVARGAGPGDLVGQLVEGAVVEMAVVAGDRRRADLDHGSHRAPRGAGSSAYSSSTGPIRTTSPAWAPARARARSTPRRRKRSRT